MWVSRHIGATLLIVNRKGVKIKWNRRIYKNKLKKKKKPTYKLTLVRAVANCDWSGGGKSQASRHTQRDVDTVSARRLENACQTDLAALAVRGHVLTQDILDLPTGGVGHYGAGHWGNTDNSGMTLNYIGCDPHVNVCDIWQWRAVKCLSWRASNAHCR